jgi:intracellular septation protein
MTLSPQVRSTLRIGIDYAALAVFVATWLITRNPQLATWWLVGISAAAIVANFVLERRLAPLPLIYGSAALVFGALSLIYHDPRIIKMKTTFVDLALGIAMLVGLFLGKSPIKVLIGESLKMSEAGWRRLTLSYGLFFLALAALNEVIWRTQSDSTWLLFRFPGSLILALLFSFTQIPMMFKEAKAFDAAAKVVDTQQ